MSRMERLFSRQRRRKTQLPPPITHLTPPQTRTRVAQAGAGRVQERRRKALVCLGQHCHLLHRPQPSKPTNTDHPSRSLFIHIIPCIRDTLTTTMTPPFHMIRQCTLHILGLHKILFCTPRSYTHHRFVNTKSSIG